MHAAGTFYLFRRAILAGFALFVHVLPVSAVTRVSLGYGMQLNAMLNSVLAENMNRQLLNSGNVALNGQSAGTDYRSQWSAGFAEAVAPYTFVHLPEIRVTADWPAGDNRWGIFTSFSGLVPQTTMYYAGAYQVLESRTCATVDYTNCPLAALNFVASSGSGIYGIELRTTQRFYSLTGGVSWDKQLGVLWGGIISVLGEAGLNFQSFTMYSQFAALRCSNAAALPCTQNAQVRSVQGELNMQALFAAGPYLGVVLRFERPQDRWFSELGFSAIFQFARLANTGYTNFVAGGTVAFSQPSSTLGIDAEQNFFAVLPALSIRAGIRL